jgi:hypothetical protein
VPLDDPTRGRERQALNAGGDALARAANVRAPRLSGRMSQSWHTVVLSDSEAVCYNSAIYSRKQHERTWQQHVHGGAAKFLALAVELDGDDVAAVIGRELFGES